MPRVPANLGHSYSDALRNPYCVKQTKKTTISFTVYRMLLPDEGGTALYFQSLSRLRRDQEGAETWVSEWLDGVPRRCFSQAA